MKKILFSLSLLLAFFAGSAFGQSRTADGYVTHSVTNAPLHNVQVLVKGTSRSVLTQSNGYYSIVLNPGDSVLAFHLPGMDPQEIRITSTRINVSLKPEPPVRHQVIHVLDFEYEAVKMNEPSLPSMGISTFDRHINARHQSHFHEHNTESYTHHSETGYQDVLLNPLSTFSIDVDNAAYSNVRRFINSGHLPPPDAVRVEELLNYFTYNYPAPTGRHPFAVHTELSQSPWNPQAQLLHVGLKGREMDKSELPPSNLVFLIDISGSMSPANRLPLVKTAMTMLVEELRPIDRVAIVVYASRTEVVLESTPASQKETIINAIQSLRAGGSTAGGQALRLAYSVAEKNFMEKGNNRIIMCTDGDFNVGESSNAAMERLVEEKRRTGVFITVLGFGMGNYKDDRLEIIANKGNGNYAYIDNIQEARKVLVSEFAGTLFTIAKDVKLQIEFNPARVKAYRLIGYENRRLNDEDFNDDTKDAGEMGAGHSVTALYEIIPAGSDFTMPGVDPLRYQQNPVSVKIDPSAELLTIKARYKEPDSDRSVAFETPVRGRVVPLSRTSDDFRFAAAVAQFGLVLRNSPYKYQANLENAEAMALGAKGSDKEGYRAEFINLVRTARTLDNLGMERE